MANIIPSGKDIFFDYTAYDLRTDLQIAMKVFDLSTGTPVLVTTLPMIHSFLGCYRASYNFQNDKSYLLHKMVYTDGTYTTPHNKYSPSSEMVHTHNFETLVETINAKLGSPTSSSVSADLASIKSDTSGLRADYTTARATKLDFLDVAVSSREADSMADSRFNSLSSGISSIRNNTNFVGHVPSVLLLPTVGIKNYKFFVNLFDTEGNLEDPDGNTIQYRIEDVQGNIVFPSTPMTRVSQGNYMISYQVNATDIERQLIIYFDYVENGIALKQVYLTEIQEFESKLDLLVSRLTQQRATNLDFLDAAISSRESEANGLTRFNTLSSGLTSLINDHQNTFGFSAAVPELLEVPISGSRSYKFVAQTFDHLGRNIDPDSNLITYRVISAAGATVQVSTPMLRDDVGIYLATFTRLSTDPEEGLIIYFEYTINGVKYNQSKVSESAKITYRLDDILNNRLTLGRSANLDFIDAPVSSREAELTAVGRYNSTQGAIAGVQTTANALNTKLGTPATTSISGDIASVKTDTNKIGSPSLGTLSADLSGIKSDTQKIGTPAGTSLASDIAAVQTKLGTPASSSISGDLAQIKSDTNKLGAPANGSVSSDLAAIQAKLGIPASSTISGDLQTLIGYNSVLTTRIGNPAGASVSTDIASIKQDSTTLLTRLSSQRAQLLDNIDVPVSSREAESAASARYSQLEAEHTSILAGIGSIPNNTTFVGIVPPTLVLPESGTKTYKFYVNLFNTDGTPGDPDSNIISLRVMDLTANVLAGPTNMTQLGVGRYVFNYVLSASDVEQPLQVVFEYTKDGTFYQHRRLTEVQEFESKLDLLIQRITAQRALNLDNLNAPVSTLETDSSAAARQTLLISQLNQILTSENALSAKIGTPQSDLSTEIATALTQLGKLGNPSTGTLAGDISSVLSYAQKIGIPGLGSLAAELALIESRLGSPTTSSLSLDLVAIKQDTAKIGNPIQGSISADIADVKAQLVSGGPLSNQVAGVQTTISQVNSKLGTPLNGSISLDVSQLNTKLGNPVSGSMASELSLIEGQLSPVTSILTKVNTIDSKLGNPLHGDLASDIANIDTTLDTGNLQPDITLIKNRIGLPSVTLADELGALVTAVNSLPTSPLLSTDPRLNYLDAPISSRATPGSIGSSGSGDGVLDLFGFVDSDDSELELVGIVEE